MPAPCGHFFCPKDHFHMISRIAIGAVCFALSACGGGGQPVTVDLYGDSIMSGYGVQVSPADRIRSARPDWGVVDHSVPGTPLKALMPGFSSSPRTGQVVVIGNGFVDAYQGIDGYAQDLRTAVLQVVAEGRTPVLTGVIGTPNPPALAHEYNAATHQIAKEYGLAHAGWGEAYREGDASPDGIHRTQAASDRLADLLIQAIEKGQDE